MTCWLVSGSRDFPDKKLAVAVLTAQFRHGDILFHGGARGVDQWAAEIAVKKGMQINCFPANWDKYGKSAGFKRNRIMVDDWYAETGYKRALVLWDGASLGTKHTLDMLQTIGCPLTLVQANYD